MRIVLLLILVFPFVLFSQKVTGLIEDEAGDPIEFVKLRLLNPDDSTVVSGAYSDDDGVFEFTGVSKGKYLLSAKYSGFEDYYQAIETSKGEITLQPIILKVNQLQVEETVVVGSLDALKAGIDKKIYSVNDDLMSKGGSVNDVLNNIPSIDIDENGNISLRGDGNVTILIDGRPSALAMGDGQNLLDAIPANSIEKIEVVTNPSAKYDPDGTSGIINIVMKKNKKNGLNGIVGVTVATGSLAEANAGLSWRKNKWNLFGNYSFNYREGYRNNFSELYQTFENDSSNYLDQTREGTDLSLSNTLVFGVDYHFSDRSVFGLSATGNIGERERKGDLITTLFDDDSIVVYQLNRISRDPRLNQNGDVNLNYSYKFLKDKGELSAAASQSYGGRDISGYYDQYNLDGNGNVDGEIQSEQRLFNDQRNRVSTIQSDFSWIFDSIRARIEIGVKYINRSELIDTYSEAFDTNSQFFIPDTLANFNYKYVESFSSTYATFGQELGRFKYQVGGRFEYAQQLPELISTGEKFPKNYFKAYPSAHLRYEISKKNELSLSYSKRVNRPSSRNLNPFISYANPFNLRSGNPDLKPEFIDSYDFGYSYIGSKFISTFSVYHRRTKDVIQRVRLYFSDNSSLLTFENIDESAHTGIEAIFIIKPTTWMKNTISMNGSYVNYTDANESELDWNNDGFNWNVEYSGSFDFWKNSATLQLNVRYRSPRIRPQGVVQPRTGLDVSFEKRLLNKKLSIGVRVTDVFNTKGFVLELTQPNVWQYSEYKWLTRRAYVTCSYRFGNYKDKKTKRNGGEGGME